MGGRRRRTGACRRSPLLRSRLRRAAAISHIASPFPLPLPSVGHGLESGVKELESRAKKLQTLMDGAFKGTIKERYRDHVDEIRTTCAYALGKCVERLPETYLYDTYLKFYGWLTLSLIHISEPTRPY